MFLLLGTCSAPAETEITFEDWGSFRPDKTYSYDRKYYALQEVLWDDYDGRYISVDVYLSENDSKIYSFVPARARDFWGICWESDTYNIWTQSGDIGVYCYKYENDTWIKDEDAIRPPDVISKYDD